MCAGWGGGDGVDDVHAFDNFTKDAVSVWQWRVFVHDEELTAVGVWSGVGHGHRAANVGVIVVQFVGELVAWTTGSGAGWITALDHEAVNDAMENQSVVVSAIRQVDEVGNRVRRSVVVQLKDDVALIRGETNLLIVNLFSR